MFHRLFCQSIDASMLLPLRKIRWPTTWSIKEVLMFQAQKLLLWQCEMSRLGHDVLWGAHIHIGVHFIGFPNFLTSWRSWSVPATPFVRAQWSSWRLTPGTVVQWRCDTSTHRYGVTWVMHRSHRCRCLDVPLFERGYGKECFFCCAPPSSADWWCIYCMSLEDPADIAKNAIAHAKSNGCVLDFDASLRVCTEWVIASTAEVMMLF